MTAMSALPKALRIAIGGYRGSSYGLRWEADRLIYEAYQERYELVETHEISPASEQWQQFWTTLDRLGTWNWSGSYRAEGIVDGTSWGITLEHQGRSIQTSGSNAYPGSEGDFEAFLAAVRHLIGGRAFR